MTLKGSVASMTLTALPSAFRVFIKCRPRRVNSDDSFRPMFISSVRKKFLIVSHFAVFQN